MQWIARNLIDRCPSDPYIGALKTPRSMVTLLERGWIGEKVGQGYYRKEGRELVALDFQTMAYRQKQDVRLPGIESLSSKPMGQRIADALQLRDEVGDFLRAYLVPTLQYANYLKEQISHNVLDFDRVMMWGFGWEKGPFQMIDEIGADKLGIDSPKFYVDNTIREFDGSYVKIKAEQDYATIEDYEVVDSGQGYSLRDLGDGVTAVCLTTKLGVLDPDTIRALNHILEEGKLHRIVLTSESRCFSAGFDLKFVQQASLEGREDLLDLALMELQRLGTLLEQIPSVAAVFGHCLGAGFETALSCSMIAALADSHIGLPEAKVGLLPAGRGTAMMRLNNQYSTKKLAEVACQLVSGATASNADLARQMGYLRASDVTVYHPDRLITEAKRLASDVARPSTESWKQVEGPVGGMIDRLCLDARSRGEVSDYDETISSKIKQIFVKPGSFEEAMEWERREFLDLSKRALTQARIKHMLENGKPLRN
jgi:3-hydroxyacyl-CoA dehydrogenase